MKNPTACEGMHSKHVTYGQTIDWDGSIREASTPSGAIANSVANGTVGTWSKLEITYASANHCKTSVCQVFWR